MNNLVKNYCFSGWIANLGVEPLFLFVAFLFAPAAFFLFFLLFLVTVVLDGITISSFNCLNFSPKMRSLVLVMFCLIVKGFLIPQLALGQDTKIQEFIIAKGEQIELGMPQLLRYSIGNSEVISLKYGAKTGKMLIKGKGQGFSDLIIWQNKASKLHYKFYVVSKNSQLKNIEALRHLNTEHFELKFNGSRFHIAGTIHTQDEYQIIKKLNDKHNHLLDVNILPATKRDIIAEIYKLIYNELNQFVNCRFIGIDIECTYSGKEDAKTIEMLKHKYGINFIYQNKFSQKNYLIIYQIVQIETYIQETFNPGLGHIASTIGKILNKPNQIFHENDVLFNDGNINAKLVAAPKALSTLGEQQTIQMGAEIPFQTQTQLTLNTQWRFAGLKVISKLVSDSEKLKLKYQNHFTRPIQETISGTKSSGNIYINPNHFVKFFEVTYESDEGNKSSLPILNKIPLIKELFTASRNMSAYKQIIAYVKVIEQKD